MPPIPTPLVDTLTASYDFVQPEVGASDDTWGDKLNANWAKLDALLTAAFSGGTPALLGLLLTTAAEMATQAEAEAGTADNRFLSPLLGTKLLDKRIATQAIAEAGTDAAALMAALNVAQYVTARLATQAIAQAGADNTKLMTALRVKDYLDARAVGYQAVSTNSVTMTTVDAVLAQTPAFTATSTVAELHAEISQGGTYAAGDAVGLVGTVRIAHESGTPIFTLGNLGTTYIAPQAVPGYQGLVSQGGRYFQGGLVVGQRYIGQILCRKSFAAATVQATGRIGVRSIL